MSFRTLVVLSGNGLDACPERMASRLMLLSSILMQASNLIPPH